MTEGGLLVKGNDPLLSWEVLKGGFRRVGTSRHAVPRLGDSGIFYGDIRSKDACTVAVKECKRMRRLLISRDPVLSTLWKRLSKDGFTQSYVTSSCK